MYAISNSIHRLLSFLYAIIPSVEWWPYAASRIGTFIMSYFAIISATIIGLTLFGVTATIGLLLGIIPFAVLLAVRISGALTRNMKYKKENTNATNGSI
tara:strand:+ start:5094 stop:5390 length:297 start_codon:yes stop_codon:yes gene_type:complete